MWATLEGYLQGEGDLVIQENMAPFNAVEEVISPRHTRQCPGKFTPPGQFFAHRVNVTLIESSHWHESQHSFQEQQNILPVV